MQRRAWLPLAAPVFAVVTVGGAVSATLPPDEDGGTDFVRRQAEVEVTAYFAESGTTVSDVACAAPPADTGGAQMRCYATDGSGTVVTAVATINDLGGIEVAAGSGGGESPTTTGPPATPAPVVATYNGSGSAARPVDPITAPTIVRVTHDGTGAFSVQPQQGGVAAGPSLLDITGGWDGRYLIGLGGTISGFAITADGNWTLELHSISTAPALAAGAPVAGDSPDVLSYANADAGPVTVEYSGSGSIVVRAVTSAGAVVVVDEPAAFTGEITLPPGPGNVLVEAVGPWTLSFPAPPPTTTAASTTGAPTTAAPTTAAAATTVVATVTT